MVGGDTNHGVKPYKPVWLARRGCCPHLPLKHAIVLNRWLVETPTMALNHKSPWGWPAVAAVLTCH